MAGSNGLTDEQIQQLRDEVAEGRSPRVRISGSQFGAAAAGTVRRVGDPATDGDDFVTVRVKINGVTDDLRFAPRELSRGRQTKAAAEPPKQPRSRGPRGPRRPSAPEPQATAPPPTPPAPAGRPKKAARRAPTSAPVTVTFTSSGTSWTVSAHRGARSVVKNAPVTPGVVSAVAAMLDVPALQDVVAAVNDTARAEAESRAEQLRAELAQLEAVLDSHRRP